MAVIPYFIYPLRKGTTTNRSGDHIWHISDVGKFQTHYPVWGYQYNLEAILEEMYHAQTPRLP